jgi:hypothetical protein
MQEHPKQVSKASAKEKDIWKCTSTHFVNVLNFNDKTFNVISTFNVIYRRMYLHLCFGDCK